MNPFSRLIRVLSGVLNERVERQFERGMIRAGLLVQRESQKIVPVDTGALRNSARTEVESGHGFNVVVAVSYNTHYAVYVHEDLTMRHRPGKVAKFLEIPFRILQPRIIDIIVDEMSR